MSYKWWNDIVSFPSVSLCQGIMVCLLTISTDGNDTAFKYQTLVTGDINGIRYTSETNWFNSLSYDNNAIDHMVY